VRGWGCRRWERRWPRRSTRDCEGGSSRIGLNHQGKYLWRQDTTQIRRSSWRDTAVVDNLDYSLLL
jgi:hypothetical protein